jgi:LysR family transcriptional regulator (chromosome initiation inhibitor)
MLPEAQLGTSLQDGTLMRPAGSRHADVRLFWQRWRVGSDSLDQLTDLVVRAARRELRAG